MPSPVPPGYTRGPLTFIGPTHSTHTEEQLLQVFWNLAGAFGARIVHLVPPTTPVPTAERQSNILTSWGCDSFTSIAITDRTVTANYANTAAVDASTAIIIAPGNPHQLASILGGTPMAQAIRRANACGKTVCTVGTSMPLSCQHMLLPNQRAPHNDFPYRSLVQFVPGLGLINRTTVHTELSNPSTQRRQQQANHNILISAVAHNPFLIAIQTDPDTGFVLHADNTIEIHGLGVITIVNTRDISNSTIWTEDDQARIKIDDLRINKLKPGTSYNIDSGALYPAQTAEEPSDNELKSAY